MIDTKAIRSKILDLAMHGKISIQNENEAVDFDAEVATDIPYAIPSNWKWVTIESIIAKNVGGGTPSKSVDEYWKNGTIPWMSVKDFSSARNGVLEDTIDHITQEGLKNSSSNLVDVNAIIICMRMALGKIVKLKRPMAINQDLRAIWLNSCVDRDYFIFYYSTLRVEGHGMTVAGINKKQLMTYLMPLPPFAEQKRIVEKIEQAFSVLDTIDELQAKYADNLTALKSKLIDLAIRGKLTDQLPEDGTAEELYRQIQEEKTDFINTRKGRKDNSILPIDENIPFGIPENWKWIRFGETGFFRKGPFGSSLTKSMFVPKSQDTVKVYEQQHAIKKDHTLGTYYITREYFDASMKGFEVMPGDIIVSCAGTIGETYIMPKRIECGIINQALMRITIVPSIDKRFFIYYFDSQLKSRAKDGNGMAITNIPPFDVLKNLYFPLPPLAEQKRIVDRLDHILAVCDEMR